MVRAFWIALLAVAVAATSAIRAPRVVHPAPPAAAIAAAPEGLDAALAPRRRDGTPAERAPVGAGPAVIAAGPALPRPPGHVTRAPERARAAVVAAPRRPHDARGPP